MLILLSANAVSSCKFLQSVSFYKSLLIWAGRMEATVDPTNNVVDDHSTMMER